MKKETKIFAINNPDGGIYVCKHECTREEYIEIARAERKVLGLTVHEVFEEEARKAETDVESFFDKENADRINATISSINILLEQESYRNPMEVSGGSPGLGKGKS